MLEFHDRGVLVEVDEILEAIDGEVVGGSIEVVPALVELLEQDDASALDIVYGGKIRIEHVVEGEIIIGEGQLAPDSEIARSFVTEEDNYDFVIGFGLLNSVPVRQESGRGGGLLLDPLDDTGFLSATLVVNAFTIDVEFERGVPPHAEFLGQGGLDGGVDLCEFYFGSLCGQCLGGLCVFGFHPFAMSTPGRIEHHEDMVGGAQSLLKVVLGQDVDAFFDGWLGTGKANDKGDEN